MPIASRTLTSVATLAVAVAIAACNPLADDLADTESIAVDDASADASDPESASTLNDSVESPGPGRDAELPDPLQLDLEVHHPNGTYVRLNGMRFTQTTVEIDATMVNGHTFVAPLNSHFGGGAVLEDDLGTTYGFLPPEGNSSLNVESGEQMEGTLVFTGRLAAGATAMTLTFNPEGVDSGIAMGNGPRLTFAGIPVRGTGDRGGDG